jgi:hypothetical protein
MVFNINSMKRILLLALIFISLNAFGQGNLQFNQVLNIKNGDNYTVPAGKVLKITAVSISSKNIIKVPFLRCDLWQGSYFCTYNLDNIIVGNIGSLNYYLYSTSPTVASPGYYSLCSQCPSSYDYTGGVSIGFQTPFWLKSGENITIAQGSGVLISAIEFNIIP